MSFSITSVESNFEREPLKQTFGFKGGKTNELWQSIVHLWDTQGHRVTGLGVQGVLWSDAKAVETVSEVGANILMFSMTNYALTLVRGRTFESPRAMLMDILPQVEDYGKRLSGLKLLRRTFVLNSLVAVDNAAWLLDARSKNIANFDDMIPEDLRSPLIWRHNGVAAIPLVSYNVSIDEIINLVQNGFFFLKIKLGQHGDQETMLRKDMARISEIHNALRHMTTPYTKNGKIPYYFDANGRYQSKETLMRLLDFTRTIGAFEQIVLVEEPFADNSDIDVHDIPVRLAADESADSPEQAKILIERGYSAFALKAIAKTMTHTLEIATIAQQHKIPCFCADLTVSPFLLEWNKALAARLTPFPGLDNFGLLECNGPQNYRNWNLMTQYHPYPTAYWAGIHDGFWHLNEDYYRKSGALFASSPHYESL
ncbi:MAG: enolase C-terminal domain-like protein [Planctomycetia bacterium]|nr:enolase C-terminal domain-like protein [Planctomycetia bacterium]